MEFLNNIRKPLLGIIIGAGLFVSTIEPGAKDLGTQISAIALIIYGMLRRGEPKKVK